MRYGRGSLLERTVAPRRAEVAEAKGLVVEPNPRLSRR